MRTFIGLPVPEPWIAPLIRAQGRLPGGRKVDADDLHLTLAFLDDQPEARIADLEEALEMRALPAAPLTPVAYSAFGSDRTRLVALDVAPAPDLTVLRDTVRRAVREVGIDLSRERFRPHVTLLRFPAAAPPDTARMPRAMADLGTPDLAPETARLAILWSSTLTPDGPVYDPIARYPLRGAGGIT